MGIRFFKIALVYLVLGVALGIVLGITQKFQFAPVHAHINLLGWATFALAGLIYVVFPQAAKTRLAVWQFWLQNIGVPIFIIGLTLLASGDGKALPFVIVGSLVTLLAVITFLVNVFANVREVTL
ncbi:MAG: cytochrome-c oxidase [Candidatus Eremiobacteraeota bacterium]|nr:cytochrome-c oxidase [Candidatus Eremiobacteraeota bacterium]